MESIYPELALCGNTKKCARTDTVFFPIAEVSEGMVSLVKFLENLSKLIISFKHNTNKLKI